MAAFGSSLTGQRLRHWWRSRAHNFGLPFGPRVLPAPSDTLHLPRQRIYLMPTQAGCGFALLTVVLLVGAHNDSLWLGHTLAYLSLACLLVDLIATYRNLAGLVLHQRRPAPVFAGQAQQLTVEATNPGTRARYALRLHLSGHAKLGNSFDVGPQTKASVTLALATSTRGWLPAPRLTLSSTFPLGLFRAWAHWQPASGALVYPRPDPAAPLPPLAPDSDQARRASAGELAGIRAYQAGDSAHQMAWRQMARLDPHFGGPLLSKELNSAPQATIALDLDQLPAQLDLERRLSHLTHWVLQAEQRALPYALKLGSTFRPAALGAPHQAACLRALALYQRESAR